MIEIQQCPLCKSAHLQKKFIQTRDFFLSDEDFYITKCLNCSFLFTDPRPEDERLDHYYKSEEYLSHDSRISSLKDWLYQIVKKYALKNKFRLVKKHSGKAKGRMLDFGCGTGDLLNYFSKHGWDTTGIEPNEKARNHGINKLALNVLPSVDALKRGDKFDVIMLWHVIEHLPALHDTMEQLKSKLKPGGTFFVAIPNIQSPDSKHYAKYWAALDVPRHLYHFDKETFRRFAKARGFKVPATLPLKFDSFYVSLLSEKYRGSKLALLKAFYQGLRSNMQASSSNNYSSLIFVLK